MGPLPDGGTSCLQDALVNPNAAKAKPPRRSGQGIQRACRSIMLQAKSIKRDAVVKLPRSLDKPLKANKRSRCVVIGSSQGYKQSDCGIGAWFQQTWITGTTFKHRKSFYLRIVKIDSPVVYATSGLNLHLAGSGPYFFSSLEAGVDSRWVIT